MKCGCTSRSLRGSQSAGTRTLGQCPSLLIWNLRTQCWSNAGRSSEEGKTSKKAKSNLRSRRAIRFCWASWLRSKQGSSPASPKSKRLKPSLWPIKLQSTDSNRQAKYLWRLAILHFQRQLPFKPHSQTWYSHSTWSFAKKRSRKYKRKTNTSLLDSSPNSQVSTIVNSRKSGTSTCNIANAYKS